MIQKFTDKHNQEASLYPQYHLARVVSQYNEIYKVATEDAELLAQISGKLRHACAELMDFPVVGDFVMIDRIDAKHGNAVIHHVLSRKSLFVRKAAGTSHDVQPIAANIDTVFICMSLNHDFNLRRLERYLSIAWDSGAIPVIVLTKSDICTNLPERLTDVETVSVGSDVIVTSCIDENGYNAINKYITTGKTAAFIGSSGVGKSTLINRLLGDDIIETKTIRKNEKGQHSTTRRELYYVPCGGAVIDTPGMREIGVDTADLSTTFADIEEMQCRFSDCRHENEPGCMVRQAIRDGMISNERFENYKKLQRETKYDGLNSRQIEKEKINDMYSGFGGIKNAKDYIKNKNRID